MEKRFAPQGVAFLSVGDAVRARRIIEGVAEGRNILNLLHQSGFLSRRVATI